MNIFKQFFEYYLLWSRLRSITRKICRDASKRKFIVGGNWKMNGTKKSIKEMIQILEKGPLASNVDVFVGVPTIYLGYTKCLCPPNVQLAAQNCYKLENGAFTGETSPAMLKDLGIDWVILGHSERRHIFGETNKLIAEKVLIAKKFKLKVVACIGETLAEREANKTQDVVFKQTKAIADKLCDNWNDIVFAYEPVWAIGTGKTASPKQAQEIHSALRCWIRNNISEQVAEQIRIQYGGSVTEKNCNELANQPDIDGFLVGGASLKPEFIKIINSKQ